MGVWDPPKSPPRPPTHLWACAAPGGGGSLPAGAGSGSLSRPGGSLGPHSKPGRPEGVLGEGGGGVPKRSDTPPEEEGEGGGSEGVSPCAGGSRVLITNTPGCCTCRSGGHDPPSGGTCVFGEGRGKEVNPPKVTRTPTPTPKIVFVPHLGAPRVPPIGAGQHRGALLGAAGGAALPGGGGGGVWKG